MLRIALLMLVAGVAQAASNDTTFLVTGTITGDMWGNTQQAGETLQFEYTIDPSVNPQQDPSQRGPITSIAYSVNGGAFIPDNGWGTVNLQNDGFTLYPGSGQQITYDPTQHLMFFFDHDNNGDFANVTNFQQMGVSQSVTSAPEIDPRGLTAGLTLLIGGLLVLRGPRRLKRG